MALLGDRSATETFGEQSWPVPVLAQVRVGSVGRSEVGGRKSIWVWLRLASFDQISASYYTSELTILVFAGWKVVFSVVSMAWDGDLAQKMILSRDLWRGVRNSVGPALQHQQLEVPAA